MKRNDDARWDLFDPQAYESHNYATLRPEDDWILQQLVSFFRDLGDGLDVVDVGTGPNLTPLIAALPRARTITAWDYSQANVDWLRRAIDGPLLPSNWIVVSDRLRSLSSEYQDDTSILSHLRSKLCIERKSLFDLPPESWDVGTMEFCAESITADREEFVFACKSFIRAVRDCGSVFATFMEQSHGYTVQGVSFPAVPIAIEDLYEIFGPHVKDLQITRIPISIPIRSGYTGMLMLTARISVRRIG